MIIPVETVMLRQLLNGSCFFFVNTNPATHESVQR